MVEKKNFAPLSITHNSFIPVVIKLVVFFAILSILRHDAIQENHF